VGERGLACEEETQLLVQTRCEYACVYYGKWEWLDEEAGIKHSQPSPSTYILPLPATPLAW